MYLVCIYGFLWQTEACAPFNNFDLRPLQLARLDRRIYLSAYLSQEDLASDLFERLPCTLRCNKICLILWNIYKAYIVIRAGRYLLPSSWTHSGKDPSVLLSNHCGWNFGLQPKSILAQLALQATYKALHKSFKCLLIRISRLDFHILSSWVQNG